MRLGGRTRVTLPAMVAGAVLRVALRAYQLLLSPVLPPACRYLPSCSDYALEAVTAHGPWRGGGLALRRLARCHPWGGSGYDPVPLPHSAAPAHIPASGCPGAGH
jgi:uncharacterized protein